MMKAIEKIVIFDLFICGVSSLNIARLKYRIGIIAFLVLRLFHPDLVSPRLLSKASKLFQLSSLGSRCIKRGHLGCKKPQSG